MILLLLLSLAILLHELGHFVVARCLGVRVSRFCLFFDPGFCLFSTGNRFKTEFRIGWLPLGGYVKYDIPDGEPQPKWSIMAQSPWRRIVISLAGVSVNLFIAYTSLFIWEKKYLWTDEVPVTFVMERTAETTYYGLDGCRETLMQLYVPPKLRNAASYDIKKEEKEYTHRFFPSKSTFRLTTISVPAFLGTVANINLMLFFINILPIPPLDGAQVLFSTYELIFRRPINETLRIVLVLAGTLLLLGTMAFDMLSDILHFLHSLL